MEKFRSIFTESNYAHLFFICLVLFEIKAYAQDVYYDQYFNQPHYTSNPSFTSPEASCFGEYTDLPVSLYTGVPEISIPIYEIKIKDFTLPISLSYHSSGIRVEEIANWVGLGWCLNAGGVITREIRGIPDDQYEVNNLKDEAGTHVFCTNAGYLYSGNIISDFCNGIGELTEEQFWKLSHGGLDGEPDIFCYNFFGYTGKFILDYQGNPHQFEQDNLIISFSKEQYGFIDEFVITTDDGIVVTFSKKEQITKYKGLKTDKIFHHNWDGDDNVDTYTTAWYISSISFPYTQHSIDFEYSSDEIITLRRNREERRKYRNSPWSLPYWASYYYNTVLKINSLRLDKIIWNGGEMDFIAGLTRDDYDIYMDGIWTSNTQDAKALTEIKVYNTYNMLTNNFKLEYAYFESGNLDNTLPCYIDGYSKRLKLNAIYKIDQNENESDKFFFHYNNTKLPHRFSYEQDYWGYYNANYIDGLNPDKTLIPNLYEYPEDGGINDFYNFKYQSSFSFFQRSEYSTFNYFDQFANRDPNPDAMQACILHMITFPTGGFVKFEYEPNDFYLDNQNITGGGVRIKTKISNDITNPNVELIKTFNYKKFDNSVISSGKIINIPQFVRASGSLEDQYWAFSVSLGDIGVTNGSFVGYENVTLDLEEKGKIQYWFGIPASFGEETAGCDENMNCIFNRTESEMVDFISVSEQVGNNNFPYPPNPNYDWNRGLLLEQIIYSHTGDLIKKVINEYSTLSYNKINALKVKDWIYIGYIGGSYVNFDYIHKYGRYYYLTTWNVLSQISEITYDQNENEIISVLHYQYGNPVHKYVTEKSTVNSDGSLGMIVFTYPDDVTNPEIVKSTPEIISHLKARNVVAPVLKKEKYKDQKIIGGEIRTFDFYNNNSDYIYPSRFYILEDDNYLLNTDVLKYDLNGNICQLFDKTNGEVSFFWAYEEQYPIVSAENISWDELSTVIQMIQPEIDFFLENLGNLEEPTQRLELDNFNESLRENLDEGMVVTNTFVPLVGMSSETSARNSAKYYFFDSFNRLVTIRDHNFDLLKHFDYDHVELQIEASPTQFYLNHLQQTISANIESNMVWEVISNEDWLSVLPPASGFENGTFTVFCADNFGSQESRTGTLCVISSSEPILIYVTQDASPYINAQPLELSFGFNGSTETVEISSNINWNVIESIDWISVNPDTGQGNDVISVGCDLNNTGEDRSGNIMIQGANVSVTINVFQNGHDTRND